MSRYFREVGGVVSFKPADMELFVSNCPAVQLKSLIEERMWFHNIQGMAPRNHPNKYEIIFNYI